MSLALQLCPLRPCQNYPFDNWIFLFQNVIFLFKNIHCLFYIPHWKWSTITNTQSALWLLMAWCFSTRPSVDTVLIIHPSVSSGLWVNIHPNAYGHLTHWRWVMHICISKLTIIGSEYGLSAGHQAIIWNIAGILLIFPLGANFSEIFIKIHTSSFKKRHLKMLSVKCYPFCFGLNMLAYHIFTVCHPKRFRISWHAQGSLSGTLKTFIEAMFTYIIISAWHVWTDVYKIV